MSQEILRNNQEIIETFHRSVRTNVDISEEVRVGSLVLFDTIMYYVSSPINNTLPGAIASLSSLDINAFELFKQYDFLWELPNRINRDGDICDMMILRVSINTQGGYTWKLIEKMNLFPSSIRWEGYGFVQDLYQTLNFPLSLTQALKYLAHAPIPPT